MNPVIKSLCLVLAILLGAGCATTSTEQPVQIRPDDFSGSWELDYKLTEDPRTQLRWLYEVARSQLEQQQLATRSQVRSGQIPVSAANNKAISDLQGVIKLGTLAEMITRSTVLTIEQSEDFIVVQRDGDFALTCEFAGGLEGSGNALGQEYCGVDRSGQLLFIVSLPNGLIVENRLVLSADRKRLNVATTVKTSRLPQTFTLKRVYMPFEPGNGGYDCEYTLAKKNTCWLGPSE